MPDVLQPYDGAYTGPQIDEAIGRILTNEYIGRSAAIKEKSSEAEPCDLSTIVTKGIHFIEYYTDDFHTDSAKPYFPIYLFINKNENTGMIGQRYQAFDGMWYTRFIDPLDPSTGTWSIDNDYYTSLADTIIEYSDIEAIPKFETLEEYNRALESGEVVDRICIIEEEDKSLDYEIVFPYVGDNKNWWLMGQDLGIKAIMEVGIDYFTDKDKADIVKTIMNSEEIIELQESLDPIKAEIASNKTNISVNRSNISELQESLEKTDTNVNKNKEDITELKSQMSKASIDISKNKTNISNLLTSLDETNTNVTKNTTDIEDLQEDLNKSNEQISANKENIKTNSSDISNLSDSLNNTNKNVSANRKEITDLKSLMQTANTNIAVNTSNITELREDLEITDTNVAKNKTDISNLQTTLNTTNVDVAKNKTNIANLQTSLNTTNTNVTNNKNSIANLQTTLNNMESKLGTMTDISINSDGDLVVTFNS